MNKEKEKEKDSRFTSSRYIGNKYKMLDFIEQSLKDYNLFNNITSVADLFSGTGITSYFFANMTNVQTIIANDIEPYANILTYARLSNINQNIIEKQLTNLQNQTLHLIQNKKEIKEIKEKGGVITDLYVHQAHDRPMFPKNVALFIDACRYILSIKRESIGEKKVKILLLLASLLEFALKHNKGYGHFHSAPLTKENKENKENKTLTLSRIYPSGSKAKYKITRSNANDILEKTGVLFDFIYIDPPYTQNSDYGRWYHLLNTIIFNDIPQTMGKNNVRKNFYRSPYSNKKEVHQTFHDLFHTCSKYGRYIGISYSDNGLISIYDMKKLLKQSGFGKIKLYHFPRSGYKKEIRELFIIATNLRPL